MRKLQTQDVFKLARIIKQAKAKEEITNLMIDGKKENADAEELGIKAIFALTESCADVKVESQLYDLIGSVCEKKADEIKTQSLNVTIDDIKQIIKENDMESFFNTASHLTT